MISTANPPSVDIKDLLVSQFSYVFGTDIFVSQIPPQPDNLVGLFDTGGMPTEQYGLEKPNLQIMVRDNDYATGYGKIRDIKYFLNNKVNFEINSTTYISCQNRSDILFLGQDDKNRYQWSLNFQIIRSGN